MSVSLLTKGWLGVDESRDFGQVGKGAFFFVLCWPKSARPFCISLPFDSTSHQRDNCISSSNLHATHHNSTNTLSPPTNSNTAIRSRQAHENMNSNRRNSKQISPEDGSSMQVKRSSRKNIKNTFRGNWIHKEDVGSQRLVLYVWYGGEARREEQKRKGKKNINAREIFLWT